MSGKIRLGLLFSSLIILVNPLLYGQATGSFSGTVSDQTGLVVAGAKVTVIAQATNASREARTDDTGRYLFPCWVCLSIPYA